MVVPHQRWIEGGREGGKEDKLCFYSCASLLLLYHTTTLSLQEGTLTLAITLPLIHPSAPAWPAEEEGGEEGGREGGGGLVPLERLRARLHRERLRVPIAFALGEGGREGGRE